MKILYPTLRCRIVASVADCEPRCVSVIGAECILRSRTSEESGCWGVLIAKEVYVVDEDLLEPILLNFDFANETAVAQA